MAITWVALLPGTLKAVRQEEKFLEMIDCIKCHMFISIIPLANVYVALSVTIEWLDDLAERLINKN
ncbi:MAG: hypothetical protein ACRC1P_09680 [Cellulosilyticaceae bacterium]